MHNAVSELLLPVFGSRLPRGRFVDILRTTRKAEDSSESKNAVREVPIRGTAVCTLRPTRPRHWAGIVRAVVLVDTVSCYFSLTGKTRGHKTQTDCLRKPYHNFCQNVWPSRLETRIRSLSFVILVYLGHGIVHRVALSTCFVKVSFRATVGAAPLIFRAPDKLGAPQP